MVLEGSVFPIFVTKMGSRQARTTPTLRLIGHPAEMFEDHIMVKSTSNVYKNATIFFYYYFIHIYVVSRLHSSRSIDYRLPYV